MPSCGNGHAHYSIGHGIPKAGTMIDREDSGATAIFGFGRDFMKFKNNMPTRQQLDKICSDIPMYFADEEGHKAVANTLALVNAGIMNKDGTSGNTEIRGGKVIIGADGTPTDYLIERAGTYTQSFLDNECLYSVDIAKSTMQEIEQHLLSEGYTMYIDGWGDYFYNDNFYEASNKWIKSAICILY